MTIFFLVDIALVVLVLIYRPNKSKVALLSFFLLYLIYGLHDGHGDQFGLGYDFPHYLDFFQGGSYMYGSVDDLANYDLELPYFYFCKFLTLFGRTDFVYIFGTALVYGLPFVYLCWKRSSNPPLSVLMLFTILNTFTYLFFLAAHRQMVANTLIFLSYIIYMESNVKWKTYISIILLAIAVWAHSSSVLLVPILLVLFLSKFEYSRKTAMCAIGVTLFIGLFMSSMFGSVISNLAQLLNTYEIAERSTTHIINADDLSASASSFLTLIPFSIVSAFMLYYSDDNERNSFFGKCMLLACVLINLLSFVPLINRIITTLVLFGIAGGIPAAIHTNKNCRLAMMGVMMVLMIMAYRQYNSPTFRLLPFNFIWE